MNIIDFRKICFDKHNRAYFLRVQPDDLKVTLSQIFYVLSNLSWISNFDEDYIRESFQERAKATLTQKSLPLRLMRYLQTLASM